MKSSKLDKSKESTVSVILASRGRISMLMESVYSLAKLASVPSSVEVLIALDSDDTESVRAAQKLKTLGCAIKLVVFKDRQYYAGLHHYYNALASISSGGFILTWNDDAIMVSEGWDEALRKLSPFVCAIAPTVVNQLDYSEKYVLFPGVTRHWLEATEQLCNNPGFDSWVDVIAKELGLLLNTSSVKIEHRRFDISLSPYDSTAQEVEKSKNEHPIFKLPPDIRGLEILRIKLIRQVERMYGSLENQILMLKGFTHARGDFTINQHKHGAVEYTAFLRQSNYNHP